MATANSIKSAKSRKPTKPAKPRPDFPLTPSGNGQWIKRINKHVYCFGKWDDPQAALERYLEEREHLENGKLPPRRKAQQEPDYLSVRHLCAAYLDAMESDLRLGHVSQSHFNDMKKICTTIVEFFGPVRAVSDLMPDDFRKLREKLSKRKIKEEPSRKRKDRKRKTSEHVSAVRLKNLVIRCRLVFNFAWKECLIESPVKFGTGFSTPPKKAIRKERNAADSKFFDAEQIHALLAAGSDQLKAMILLGVNAGLNNGDIAAVQIEHFDFESGWLNFAREKTGIARRVPLWPETIAAVKLAIETRPAPKNEIDANCVFVTKYGKRWNGETALCHEFAKLKEAAGITAKNAGFTALRHTLQTIGENQTGYSFAVKALMGHVDGSMSGQYREHVSDDRLTSVTDAVRVWMYGKCKGNSGAR